MASAPASVGFTAVVAQVLLLRELLVLGGGNELTLGLMLAVWLLWTALGGACWGRWSLGLEPRTLVAALEVAIAVILPATIVAVRASRGFFHAVPGELLGPGAVLAASAASLFLFCSISGYLFAAATRACEQQVHAGWAAGTGRVYLLEAAGSAAGGLAAGLLLLSGAGALPIAFLVSALNLFCAGELALSAARTRWMARLSLAALLAVGLWLVPALDRASLTQLWPGFRLVAWQDSVYGHLDVVESEGSRSIYQSGLFLAQADDPATAEEAVHFALLQHPAPRSLLLIGGGINGSLQQALRHLGLERIDYVELDPAILRLAARYFPRSPSFDSPRVRIHAMDGRLFVKTAAESFDAIVINLPDPQTAQINRFYTREFFAEAGRRLNPGGVFSFQVRGAENYLSPELAELLRSLQRTLATEFTEVTAIPGDTIHFFAANRRGTLAADEGILLDRLRRRGLQTQYVSEYYLPFRLAPERMRKLEQQLAPRPETRLNRDLEPAAYYFGVTLWSAHFGDWYRELFRYLAKVRFAYLLLALLLLAVPALLARRNMSAERKARSGAALCVAAMGFTVMGLELLLLLGFQAIYGYLYQQMAVIIAAFMAGMALGSWLSLRPPRQRASENTRWTLPRLQAAAALSPLVVYAVLSGLVRWNSGPVLVAGHILFPAVAVLCGLMGGYQFPAASRLYFRDTSPAKGSPAALYALDLAGACLGALLLSAYLVPVFGMLRTAALIAAANLAPALAAWPERGSRRAWILRALQKPAP